MTGPSDPVAQGAQLLVQQAGGYLRNVIHEPLTTCATCATPVDGWPRCYRCNNDRLPGTAEVVAPLTYGIDRQQSGTMLRHYKDDLSSEAKAEHSRVMRRLMYVGIMKHQRCIEKQVGMFVNARVTVPSLSHRAGMHPFTAIASAMKAVDTDRLQLLAAPGAVHDRTVKLGKFVVSPQQSLAGQHVLVLDDTWTTGSNAQSAALTLSQAGAAKVSVMVAGRWLSPGFGNNAAFIKDRLKRDYSTELCPVTGAACP